MMPVFGLMLFGSSEQCAVGEVKVPCAPMNHSAIADELNRARVMGGTPTAASLRAARSHLASLEGDGYVLLVTDGAPNCNAALDGRSCTCVATNCVSNHLNCLDDVEAVNAVEELAEAGIRTYVIGYDTAGWAHVLDRMAAAGATGRTTHFPVGDQASLADALSEIGGTLSSCSYELESVPPNNHRYIRVTVDGVTIPHASVMNDGNGWILEGDRTITLVGDACEALKDGEAHDINIVVECEPILI